jgi:small subunit ribosomal protein S8
MDSIGNFLTIIRNGIRVSKPFVIAPYSKINKGIAATLQKEGFLRAVEEVDVEGKKRLKLALKYVQGESAIHELKRISKLSRRAYVGVDEIKPVIGGLGLSIMTTNRGIVSHKEAKRFGVGGEVICTVW